MGIERGSAVAEALDLGLEEAKGEGAGDGEAMGAVDGAEHGLEGAREIAVAIAATGGFLAPAKDQVVAEVEAASGRGKGAAADDLGSHAGELTLGGLGIGAEEGVRDDHAEDGIAEEFEAFVGDGLGGALVGVGGVGERFTEKIIGKGLDAKPLRQVAASWGRLDHGGRALQDAPTVEIVEVA